MARQSKKDQVREAAENDLAKFIRLVAPYRVLGHCHTDVCNWWHREEAKRNQVLLMPRDHGKSALVAFRVAQRIAKDPCVRVIYLSATSLLAEKQLKSIKDILESDAFRYYWPNHINDREIDREKWTNSEVSIDHPLRKKEGIRDATVLTGGLTRSLTGLHCDVAVYDDIVVMENAYTNEGREKVRRQYSLLTSIAGGDAEEWVVGTRYDPNDLYSEMIAMEHDVYNDKGEVVDRYPVYEVWEKQVESVGDGTGEFLWPRQQRDDGKWFGFDRRILAEKRAKYLDQRQFRAQYYNNPNDANDEAISREYFQYFDKKHLSRNNGYWYYQDRRLNIFAAMDFAYSTSKRSDYTAIVVVGVDFERNIYVLDIDRFKTTKISDYYKHLLDKFIAWGFRKLRAETTAAQKAIVEELKNQYIKPNGLALSIESFSPTRHSGTKEERIAATLVPRYENYSMWHYRGGNTQSLEEELVSQRPPHDDIKDALASALDIAIPPGRHALQRPDAIKQTIKFNSRFGGVSL